jgi:hypothetical protein
MYITFFVIHEWIIKGLTSHDVKCTHLEANEDPEQYNYLPLTLCKKYYLKLSEREGRKGNMSEVPPPPSPTPLEPFYFCIDLHIISLILPV